MKANYSKRAHLRVLASGALCIACLGGSAIAAAAESEYYKSEIAKAAALYKLEKQHCDSLDGNARDVCMQRATAHLKIAEADIRAYDKNTTAAGISAEKERIEQLHKVDREKCDALSGNAEDICDAEADAVKLRREGNLKALTARLEGHYRVAIEKCEALPKEQRADCKDAAERNYKP